MSLIQTALRRRGWLGVLLVIYCAATLRVLPWHYSDPSYAVLVERGLSYTRDWAHPLFVPAFAFYRRLLLALGYSGTMLLPIERFNIAAGAASLWVLFEMVDRRVRDPMLTAACVGFIGFLSPVIDHTLPAVSCAASFFFLTVAAYCLLDESLPEKVASLGIGFSSALALGFDIGAVAFLPVVMVVLLSRRRGRERVDIPLIFLSCLAANYAICGSFHGWGNARNLFPAISFSQSPDESIWRQKSLLWSMRSALHLIGVIKEPLVAILVLGALNRQSLRALSTRYQLPTRAFWAMCASSLLLYGANDSQNVFFYEIVLFMPLILAILCTERRRARLGFIAIAGVSIASAAAQLPGSRFSVQNNRVLAELRFLRPRLEAHGTLLMPGCPYSGLAYADAFELIAVGAQADLDAPRSCQTPGLAYGSALFARIRRELATPGRKVYAAENNLSPDPEDLARERDSGHAPRNIFLEEFRAAGLKVSTPEISPSGKSYYGIFFK